MQQTEFIHQIKNILIFLLNYCSLAMDWSIIRRTVEVVSIRFKQRIFVHLPMSLLEREPIDLYNLFSNVVEHDARDGALPPK